MTLPIDTCLDATARKVKVLLQKDPSSSTGPRRSCVDYGLPVKKKVNFAESIDMLANVAIFALIL